jgi:hypothetical protein
MSLSELSCKANPETYKSILLYPGYRAGTKYPGGQYREIVTNQKKMKTYSFYYREVFFES